MGLGRRQRRPDPLWVAYAQGIAETLERLCGNGAAPMIFHPIDVERPDGESENDGARLKHEGRDLSRILEAAFPEWRLAGLNGALADLPNRMRTARAFVYLRRHEGSRPPPLL